MVEEKKANSWMGEDARPAASPVIQKDDVGKIQGTGGLIKTERENVFIDNDFVMLLREKGKPALDGDYIYTNVHMRDVGNCVRQIYFKMMGVPDERTGTDKKFDWNDVFMMGHKVEEGVIEFVKLAGLDRGGARIRSAEFPVSGEVDRVMERNGALVCLEVKSADEYQFRKLYKEMKRGEIKETYYYQVQAYMLFQPKFEYVQLVVVNRNTGFHQTLPTYFSVRVYPDKKVHDDILKRLTILKNAVNAKVPPERPDYKAVFDEGMWVNGDWQCNPAYCPFTHMCWDIKKEE